MQMQMQAAGRCDRGGPRDASTFNADDEKPVNKHSYRNVMPQIAACFAANSFYLPDGAVLGYSAILIPQLELPKSEIKVTRLQTAWLTSLMMLVVPLGEVVAVVLMEKWGRVGALRLALVPFVVGCIVIGLANSFFLILVGKVLIGVSLAVGTSPASIYVTEVARPDLRGALITAGPLLGATGLLMAYAAGAVVAWRGVAYFCCGVALLPLLLLGLCCPESPAWLVRRGRHEEAEAALRRLAPAGQDKDAFAARELLSLIVTTRRRSQRHSASPAPAATASRGLCLALRRGARAMLGPRAARRPLLLLCVLMFLQQFTGSYVTLFYAVTFFQDVQNSMDDYTAAALVGVLRLVMAVVTLPLLSRFGRRQLLLFSATVMCASMLTSGFFSRRSGPGRPGAGVGAGAGAGAGAGVDSGRWVSPLCVLVYVCSSCVGMLSVPWILAAELFPQEVRGAAQAVVISLAHIFMFVALQTYRELTAWLGPHGVQWLYASVCALTVVFVWLLLPETHGRTAEQIEHFFDHHILYTGPARGRGRRQDDDAVVSAPAAAPAGDTCSAFYVQYREEPEGREEACVTKL